MASDESSKNILNFKDIRPVPDIIHDYPLTLRDSKIPLIIDNGSYNCRVGWATDNKPRLIFKNIIAKQRGKKETDVQIGNDITNIEVVRLNLKTQFDRNIITHYDAQEQIYDYIFSHLGINTTEAVEHPILLTEPICNPNYCRQQMSELLFECYHVPQVAYGVDSLFSLYNNHPTPANANGLVVSCGYTSTHIVPVVSGRVDSPFCRRINVGGQLVDGFLHRLLQLKYPGHFAAVTLSRAEEIVQHHCSMSVDYMADLKDWASEEYYEKNVYKMQLPFTPLPGTALSAEQMKEKKEQQIRRLKEINVKRKQKKNAEVSKKLIADEEKLERLLSVQELLEDEDEEAFNTAVGELGYTPEEFQDMINKLTSSIQKMKYKILGIEPTDSPEPKEEPVYDLLEIPDEMLTSDQQEVKKRQRMLKNASEGRAKAAKMRQEKRLQELEEERRMEQKRERDINGWLAEMRQKRQTMIENRALRKQRRLDMTKRRTQASQQRMKIISQLAQGNKKKKEDTFGQNDDDWNVYKEINKEGGDSDSEAEQEKLEEIETLLREYDPEFEGGLAKEQGDFTFDVAEYYRLHLAVERIRAPELLFQPSMLGIEQAGISETLDFVLKKYSPDVQNDLTQYVFLTGGCAMFPNFKSRLERELLAMRPFQSTFKVYTAANSVLDAWYGARRWSLSHEFKSHCITRTEYEEMGGDYMKEHMASNRRVMPSSHAS